MDRALTHSIPLSVPQEYPGSRKKIRSIDIIVAMGLKLGLLSLAYFILIVKYNKPYLPIMLDQRAYYSDMLKIIDNLEFLFHGDIYYLAKNTLYSRMIGLVGAMFWYVDPYIIALFINFIFSIIIAIYTVKIYDYFSPKSYINQRTIFYFVCLSPMINAYCLFILRDIVVTCFFVIFIYLMFRNNWTGMGAVLVLFLFLRPLLAVFMPLMVILKYVARWCLKLRLWWLWFSIAGVLLLFLLYHFGPERVSYVINYFSSKFEGEDTARIFAFGFLVKGSSATGESAGIILRFLILDAILLPLLVYATFIPFYKRANTEIRIFVLIMAAMHFSIALAYLAAFDSFTARKLLMFVPLFYAQYFCYLNIRKERKKNKLNYAAIRSMS